MNFEKGFKFITTHEDYEIIEYMERFKMYRLKNYTDNREDELMKEDQIQDYVNNIEQILIRREKNRLYSERMAKIEAEEKAKEEKEKYEYEFCYGFCDNKTDLQKGKILKILNKEYRYDGKIMTRKRYLENTIKENTCRLEIKNNTSRYTAKKVDLCYKKLKDKIEYRLYSNNSTFMEITKTEYDYALYLINNNLIEKEVKAV